MSSKNWLIFPSSIFFTVVRLSICHTVRFICYLHFILDSSCILVDLNFNYLYIFLIIWSINMVVKARTFQTGIFREVPLFSPPSTIFLFLVFFIPFTSTMPFRLLFSLVSGLSSSCLYLYFVLSFWGGAQKGRDVLIFLFFLLWKVAAW